MPRLPLDRDRVVSAAIALADDEGLEALSMRRLATSLGVVPMALYKHVKDKEALIDGVVGRLITDYPPPPSEVAWEEALTSRILAARSAVKLHPWARRAIESRLRRTPEVLGHMEAITSDLLAGGLSADLAHHVMHTLGNRIWGFSPELFPGENAPIDPADYPGIQAIAADASRRRPQGGCDEDFEFTFALQLILQGARQLRDARWSSPDADA